MLAAPIIHARTKNNDFPSQLLVSPNGFSPEDVLWARRYITQSTRYFELAGKEGRRLIFCNQSLIVSGISIRIGDLYHLCGKEPRFDRVDGNRVNYAFVGLVIPKAEITRAFDIPYSAFLDQYNTYMDLLWETPYNENGISASKSEYTPIEFPAAESVCDIPALNQDNAKCILDANYASLDSVCAKVTLIMKNKSKFAFCSDIPNVNSVIDGDFMIVTSPNAQGIMDALEREEKKRMAEAAEARPTRSVFNPPHSKKAERSSGFIPEFAAAVGKTWKNVPKAAKFAIELCGTLLVIYIASQNKKSD